jgi:hypothetical protein
LVSSKISSILRGIACAPCAGRAQVVGLPAVAPPRARREG